MRIRVEQFCSLSSNPIWQSWLYKYDPVFNQELVNHLRSSTGCGANRVKMTEIMNRIVERGDEGLIVDFLKVHFPQMIEDDSRVVAVKTFNSRRDIPFDVSDANLLTFPRRAIIDGDQDTLKDLVSNFLSDKVGGDFVIVGNRAFVEYLPASDANLLGQVPIKNWLVSSWRNSR